VSSIFKASIDGRFAWGKGGAGDVVGRCALGRGGVVPAAEKREGDGASPLGAWPMRRLFYRPDRLAAPETKLPRVPLSPNDGWCDDPAHPLYNRFVMRPFGGSHEALWRDDGVYDVVVELGYNDDPVVPGRGSAIFMHVAQPDYAPTEGCVALALAQFIVVLRRCEAGTLVEIGA